MEFIKDSCEGCVHFNAFKEYGTGGLCSEISRRLNIKGEMLIPADESDIFMCDSFKCIIKMYDLESEPIEIDNTPPTFQPEGDDGA